MPSYNCHSHAKQRGKFHKKVISRYPLNLQIFFVQNQTDQEKPVGKFCRITEAGSSVAAGTATMASIF
ncbi:MAG: hypothetical protein ACOY32_02385 [Thermodesulfobacteriota bacterium]